MSNPIGIVLGQGITPLMVGSKDDISTMNIVWFVPAAIGFFLTIWKVLKESFVRQILGRTTPLLFQVRSNHPPTPPSLSAKKQMLARNDLK